MRLAQMMGLHRLDREDGRISGKYKFTDHWQIENGRRIFWSAFCFDRFACAITGWPNCVDERDVSLQVALFAAQRN